MTRDGVYDWAIQNDKLVFPPLEMTFFLLDVRETKANKSPYVSGSSCDTESWD